MDYSEFMYQTGKKNPFIYKGLNYAEPSEAQNLGHGHLAQSVTCLATIACLTADPGVTSSILVLVHNIMEIDHEITSKAIFLLSTDSFKNGVFS